MSSRKDSVGASAHRGPLVSKLKEGLQEAVVFLRTLGSFKIPAVMERRRKELLDKLSLLQGDTIRDPSAVPAEPKELQPTAPTPATEPEEPPTTKEEKEESSTSNATSTTSSTTTTPSHGQGKITRSDSTVVSSRIKDYEKIHFSAKKEEVEETPKRWVTLKKVAKPTDFPGGKEGSPAPGADSADAEKEEGKADKTEKSKDEEKNSQSLEVEPKTERAASITSVDEGEDGEGQGEGEAEAEEEEKQDKKKKKRSKLPFGSNKLKVRGGKKRDKSPAPSIENLADMTEETAEPTPSPTPATQEEGVKIFGVLERKLRKGLGGHKKVKVAAKVQHTTLVLGGKDDLELAHCSVESIESGFELTHPQHRSGIVFKVEGDEEEKAKWVEAIKEAIQEATPEEEKEEEEAVDTSQTVDEIPSITVEEVTPSTPTRNNKRDSKALTPKPEKRLPDQGVTMKGYIHRKKQGLTTKWEKTYCVLTFQAIYFTTMEDKKEYTNMLAISADCDGKLSETKKGHDKHIQVPGLVLKLGKKIQEQFSFETQNEFRDWKDAIERVLGIGGVEELLSEDEEPEIEEDLYEELEPDYVPPLPESPRPSRPHIPEVPASDDIMIDEDIYEDTDDYLPTTSPSNNIAAAAPPSLPGRNAPPTLPGRNALPTLPGRNLPKAAASPPPSLPPRSAVPGPTLPPRDSKPGAHTPQEYEHTGINSKPGAKAPAPPPTASADDEELYDDVVPTSSGVNEAEAEEMYDDVVVKDTGAAIEEELYDDVLTATTGQSEPIQDEFYEDMAPGGPTNYVTMEKNGAPGSPEADEGEELYVDVDEPASHLNANKKPAEQLQPKQNKDKGGTFGRMFHKKDAKTCITGTLGYKAPKKSKFDNKYGAIEGSHLLIYKSAGDKRSQEKIALGESRLELGSTEAGAGKFAFRLCKGDKVHHFSLKEASELEEWVGVVKGLVKYAPVEAKGDGGGGGAEGDDIYQAKEDHIAEGDGEITFKKGTYIRLISRESPALWVGQIGNEDQVFEGKIGKFPSSKVEIAEDLYI